MAQPAQDLRFFAMSTGQGTQRLTPAGRGESAQTIFEAPGLFNTNQRLSLTDHLSPLKPDLHTSPR